MYVLRLDIGQAKTRFTPIKLRNFFRVHRGLNSLTVDGTPCSVFTPGIDLIIVDYFGLNTVSLLANTPPFAHTTNNRFYDYFAECEI